MSAIKALKLRNIRNRGAKERKEFQPCARFPPGAASDNRRLMKTILPLQLLLKPHPGDPTPLVLYHGRNCPDGFAAALAAWRFYGPAVEMRGLDHGEITTAADLPDLAGRYVYVLDFSFPPDILRAIDDAAARLVLLDHHKSAADALRIGVLTA